MNKTFLLAILVPFFAYLPASSGAVDISCSHPELCRLAKIIFSENHINNFEFTSLKIVGDPHEYEPTTTEIKNLISSPILISGPHELNPWAKKVNYQRSKTPGIKTINIPLTEEDYRLYSFATREALSHFWLYPRLFCEVKRKMEEQFVLLNYIKSAPGKKTCSDEILKIESTLGATLAGVKYPIILTHDALLPLLVTLSSKNSVGVVAIKGSGHHEEASTLSVKNLYNAMKSPKVIWLEEENIKVPQNILAKRRKEDAVIKIDTANSDGLNYFQVLYDLNDKLKAIKL